MGPSFHPPNGKTGVAIVGGGPVGLAVALELARRGFDPITVYTKPAESSHTGKVVHYSRAGSAAIAIVQPYNVALPRDRPNCGAEAEARWAKWTRGSYAAFGRLSKEGVDGIIPIKHREVLDKMVLSHLVVGNRGASALGAPTISEERLKEVVRPEPDPFYADSLGGWRTTYTDGPGGKSFPSFTLNTYGVEMIPYLAFLKDRLVDLGVKIVPLKDGITPQSMRDLPEGVVVNCAGREAGELARNERVIKAMGMKFELEPVEVQEHTSLGYGDFCWMTSPSAFIVGCGGVEATPLQNKIQKFANRVLDNANIPTPAGPYNFAKRVLHSIDPDASERDSEEVMMMFIREACKWADTDIAKSTGVSEALHSLAVRGLDVVKAVRVGVKLYSPTGPVVGARRVDGGVRAEAYGFGYAGVTLSHGAAVELADAIEKALRE